jgi:hypothetical protein
MAGEVEIPVTGWTADTLYVHIKSSLDYFETRSRLFQEELDRRLEVVGRERIDNITALDRLTMQRFEDNDKALTAALAAAEKAVGVANTANEKRLDAVNEFRAQQGDLIRSFLTRTEYQAAHSALVEKVEGLADHNAERIGELDKRVTARLAELELRLSSRLDVAGGREVGAEKAIMDRRLDITQVLQFMGVMIALAVALFAVVH